MHLCLTPLPIGNHLNIKRTKILTTEERHNFNIDNGDFETLLKILITLVQSSIQIETAAKKSREGGNSKRAMGESEKKSPKAKMCR